MISIYLVFNYLRFPFYPIINFCESSCLRVLVAYSFLPQRLKDTKFHEENIKCDSLDINRYSTAFVKLQFQLPGYFFASTLLKGQGHLSRLVCRMFPE